MSIKFEHWTNPEAGKAFYHVRIERTGITNTITLHAAEAEELLRQLEQDRERIERKSRLERGETA
jgi:hypothetical protein